MSSAAGAKVFDAHVDSLQLALDLGRDLGQAGAGHFDLERARAGGVGSAVLVCWCDPLHIERGPHGARDRTRALLAEFHRLTALHPQQLRFAGNSSELEAAHAAGSIAGIPGIEGGHSIEESLDELHWFFEHGVRVLTLVWNNHLTWVRSCQPGAGAGVPEGLSDFGRSVVRAMNELGMLVDVSHAGERAFFDALETSSRPVIASHSGCKALHAHQRNLTDEQLRELACAGGVVGIVFCTAFLSAAAQAEDRRLAESQAYKDLLGENDTETWLARSRFLQREAAPLDAEVVADHVVHAAGVAGIDHVGIGSDFDGIQRTPRGLEHAGCYGRLADLLRGRGFSGEDLAKVLGGNMERVFAEATAPAGGARPAAPQAAGPRNRAPT